MRRTIAIMITMTTYGTWLRGDQRGWVDAGKILPPDPELENADRDRLKHDIYTFPKHKLPDIAMMIGNTLTQRLELTLLALTVQTWHVHAVIGYTTHDLSDIVKRAKEAVCWGLRPGQPIWATKYDKRFCFDEPTTRARVTYVERHNTKLRLSPRPYPFITNVEEYLASQKI